MATAQYMRSWRKKNPEKEREIKTRYRIKNRLKYNLAQRKFYSRNKEKYREFYRFNTRSKLLEYKYGITEKEYNQILFLQNNVCKICVLKDRIRLSVDHCHITGNIRGLLCSKCNSILGYIKDDISILEKAIVYLRS